MACRTSSDHLTFSPDGRRLAATLAAGGIRLYDRDQGWGEAARDEDYGDQSYGAAFAPDGRLATTAFDGKVRLYAADLKGTVRPTIAIDAPGGHQPYGIAFSPPDGTRLAVGYEDSTAVTLLDGHTLAELPGPDVEGITSGNLGSSRLVLGRPDPVRGGRVYTDGRLRRFSPGAMPAQASGASCPPPRTR